jgi:hypothetical protein
VVDYGYEDMFPRLRQSAGEDLWLSLAAE